jgi:hypothetical protein
MTTAQYVVAYGSLGLGALVREPQCYDGWGVVTAADLKGLNPAANWSASRGYSDSTQAGWRRFDHPGW